jgi:ABC-type multidrug transport system ATPase subunit
MAEIVLDALRARRSQSVWIERVDLRVRNGEVLALLSPDRASASLLLDIVAGRWTSYTGRILIEGAIAAQHSQSDAPQLVRYDDDAPGPWTASVSSLLRSAARSAIPAFEDPLQTAALLDLTPILRRRPDSLDRSELRRLTIAVGLAQRPPAILLDEPTRDLDAAERERLERDITRAVAQIDSTVVYATTDADEALRVADRVAYFSNGRIHQVGTPAQLLGNPASLEIAQYLAGHRLPSTAARLTADEIHLPDGTIDRPAHVPASPAEGREVVYAAWPRLGRQVITRGDEEEPPLLVGAAAEPALVFDPDTGERLDRAKGTATRSVNVLVRDHTGKSIASPMALQPRQAYQLAVWIGARDSESIVADAADRAFPDALLPKALAGHKLQIVAHSEELKIARAGRGLFLPAHGDSERVSIGFRTPAQPGEGTIRLAFYYRRHVLQSVLITASWGPRSSEPTISAAIDYTASDLDDVARLPQRELSIVANETAGGQHRIIVNGRDEPAFGVTLFEDAMAASLKGARDALLAAHRDPKSGNSRFDRHNAKSRQEFIEDLTLLAHRGAALLEVLIPSANRRNKLVRRLREAAVESDGRAVVQIAYAAGSRLEFPWHLIYDIGLGVFTRSSEQPCRILEQWNPHAVVSALPRVCPYVNEHKLNTICPYGLWGFAHIIEVPPTTADPSSSLPLCVRHGELSAKMIIGLGDELDGKLTNRHLSRLPDRLQRELCDRRALLESALGVPERELVYFYCHGRRDYLEHYGSTQPILELGHGDYVASGDVSSWKSPEGMWPEDHWELTRPLVVINGCHTAEVTPVQAADFVAAFTGIGAAGVVGTEIMISQPVAGEAAELLLGALVRDGATVGSALQAMRRELLCKGNVIGLAYTAYCSANLALRCTGP